MIGGEVTEHYLQTPLNVQNLHTLYLLMTSPLHHTFINPSALNDFTTPRICKLHQNMNINVDKHCIYSNPVMWQIALINGAWVKQQQLLNHSCLSKTP